MIVTIFYFPRRRNMLLIYIATYFYIVLYDAFVFKYGSLNCFCIFQIIGELTWQIFLIRNMLLKFYRYALNIPAFKTASYCKTWTFWSLRIIARKSTTAICHALVPVLYLISYALVLFQNSKHFWLIISKNSQRWVGKKI